VSVNTSAAFAQYRSKRDYRAVLFSCAGLKTVQQVAELFDGRPLSRREQRGLAPLDDENVHGTRVSYTSELCFVRSSNEEKRGALRNGAGSYEYEVCILEYIKNTPPVFLVAVPFSGMARELFGKVHAAKPSADFVYLRPSLDALVEALLARKAALERIRTVGLNWAIAGDTGRSDQITLRGSDVIHSAAFRHLRSPTSNLALSLRKVQIVHEGFVGQRQLKLTFDKFGNYSVWVALEAGNLPDVFKVFELLLKRGLIEHDPAFPVRNREDEPLMP